MSSENGSPVVDSGLEEEEISYMLDNLNIDRLREEAAYTDSTNSFDTNSTDNQSETSFNAEDESATETIAERKSKPHKSTKKELDLTSIWKTNEKKKKPEKVVSIEEPEKPSKDNKESKSRNPFKMIRKLSNPKPAPKSTKVDYSDVKVVDLPQAFVTKYLGSKPTDGLHGIKHVRKQIDQLILEAENKKLKDKTDDVPIIQVTVRIKGLQIDLHAISEKRDFKSDAIPIQYVSYAVQDIKYARVVAIIQVIEMSAKHTKSVVHAYICDTPKSARKMTISVSLAFKKFTERLDNEPQLFKVDLSDKTENGSSKSKIEYDA